MAKRAARYVARSLADVAAFFGVHTQTVKAWRAEGMPGDAGRYDLAEIARWRIATIRSGGGGDDRKAQAKLVYEIQRARKLQIEADRLDGRLIEIERHESELERLANLFVSLLDRMPHELGPRVLGRILSDSEQCILEQYITDARGEIVRRLSGGAADGNGD
jgi:phage terminase Nu1 subunit (DNA packaging protein)